MDRLLIHNVTVFDGEEKLPGRHSVLLEGGRIAGLSPLEQRGQEQPGFTELRSHDAILDGDGATLLPGLIDLHVHLTWSAGPDPATTLALETGEQTILRAVGHALAHLRAGVTTVRDLGSVNDMAIRVAQAVDAGWIEGPRIVAAGRTVIMTGGHDPFWGLMVDGPQEALKAVRTQRFAGAEVIKVSATGGAYGRPTGEALDDVELLPEELQAITTEAHRFGLKVSAHAIGEQGITNCLEAGIDTIEHGQYLTDDQAARMAETGTALVPTLFVYRQLAESQGIPQYARRKARMLLDRHTRAVTSALRAGVPIGSGTDAGSPNTPHPCLVAELKWLVEVGLSPNQGLSSAKATSSAIP